MSVVFPPTNPSPVDPPTGPRYALLGRVVTMDASWQVLERGAVYIVAGSIVAVKPESAPPPDGFTQETMIQTDGTIYPGLIELHNHLSYNILPRWMVPRKYTNRSQWAGVPEYRRLISGPMQVLGQTPGCVEAIVRYVECKCLLGGVTTSQGIALFSNQGIRRYYRGIVRNVEQTGEAALPEARAHIADLAAGEATKLLRLLRKSTCLLLHLSEGLDRRAREQFLSLKLEDGNWAITPALAGIHCVGLSEEDLGIMQAYGGALIWSPLSNLLLYGETARIGAAKAAGVPIAMGADWSPTGSKNLLGELKTARLVSAALGGIFTDREIVAMATHEAAKILKWDRALGSIEAAKRADLLVLDGWGNDPYAMLLESGETAIKLVVINGIPRYGEASLMQVFGSGGEPWRVGGSERSLNLHQDTADPAVGSITLQAAQARLAEMMAKLPEAAKAIPSRMPGQEDGEVRWFLLLDEFAAASGHSARAMAQAVSPASIGELIASVGTIPALQLDPLTVVDDPAYFSTLAGEKNLPPYIVNGLAGM